MIRKEIFTIPTRLFNIHTGLVQDLGELIVVIGQYLKKPEFIGVTIHQIESGVDNGQVLIQKKQIWKKRYC